MKKIILFSLVMLCSGQAAFSQLGIKAGAAFSTVNEEGEGLTQDDVEKRSILTPVVGLTYDMDLSDLFTIQPELLLCIQRQTRSGDKSR